jgi:ribosome-associated protein
MNLALRFRLRVCKTCQQEQEKNWPAALGFHWFKNTNSVWCCRTCAHTDVSYFCLMAFDPVILHTECKFRTSRSGGKGGQHVNKVSSRVELVFDLANTTLLEETQKAILQEKLAGRINKDGLLQVIEDGDRSQHTNKENAIKKFDALLKKALTPRKKRKKTAVPKGVIEKRISDKKKRSEIKKVRKKDVGE